MPIIAKCESSNIEYEPIPEGVHVARCVSIIDIGTHYNKKFDNTSHKVLIQWELPEETLEINGEKQPRIYTQDYGLSLHKKSNLRKHLEAWRGKSFTDEELKGFDLKNVLGVQCQLQIVHNKVNDKIYANLASIMSCPKTMSIAAQVTKSIYLDWESEAFKENLLLLPQWIQDKIKDSEEMKNSGNEDLPFDINGVDDGSLPF